MHTHHQKQAHQLQRIEVWDAFLSGENYFRPFIQQPSSYIFQINTYIHSTHISIGKAACEDRIHFLVDNQVQEVDG